MSPQEAQTLRDYFAKSLDQEFKTTRKILKALPENQINFKLGDKGRTAVELARHIVSSDAWFGQGITNLNFAVPEPEDSGPTTIAELVAQYDRTLPALIAKLKAMSGEQLTTPLNFMNIETLPVVLFAGWWLSHSIHHRGQVSTYLRAMNAHVPVIYGESADEPFGTATATA